MLEILKDNLNFSDSFVLNQYAFRRKGLAKENHLLRYCLADEP